MKKKNNPFVRDVQDLLKQTTVEEATSRVWEMFTEAMSRLDATSQDLLRQFFRGVGIAELSKRHGMQPAECEAWLRKARRELVDNLRHRFQVRQ